MIKRLSFTDGELLELRRALALIECADRDAKVNMSDDAQRDKTRALAKLNRATNYIDPFAGITTSVDVRTGELYDNGVKVE